MSLRKHRSALGTMLPVAAVGVKRPGRDRKPKPKPKPAEDVCTDNGCVYEVGEEWSDSGVCNLKTCTEGGVIEEQRCPYPDIPNGCTLGQPTLGQRFPYCCPKADCSMRRDSSSSSSSSSSSDEPDKYEDLDDDDCGDDGGDMAMDFTAMDPEERSADKPHKEEASKRSDANVKPPEVRLERADTGYKLKECSESLKKKNLFEKERELDRNLTSFSSVKLKESAESVKIVEKDFTHAEVVKVKEKIREEANENSVVDTKDLRIKPEDTLEPNNDLDKVKVLEDRTRFTEEICKKQHPTDANKEEISEQNKQLENTLTSEKCTNSHQDSKKVSSGTTTDNNHVANPGKDSDQNDIVVEAVKVEKISDLKPKITPDENIKTANEMQPSLKKTETSINLKHSFQNKDVTIFKEVNLRVENVSAANSSSNTNICKSDETVHKVDLTAVANGNPRGSQELTTTSEEKAKEQNEKVNGNLTLTIKDFSTNSTSKKIEATENIGECKGNNTEAELKTKLTENTCNHDSKTVEVKENRDCPTARSNLHFEANGSKHGATDTLEIKMEVKKNFGDEQDKSIVKSEDGICSVSIDEKEKGMQLADKADQTIVGGISLTENIKIEVPSSQMSNTCESEVTDNISEYSDKNAHSTNNNERIDDKVSDCAGATSDPTIENNLAKKSMDQLEDGDTKLKEALEKFSEIKGLLEELRNEGEKEFSQGLDKVPPLDTAEEHERLYNELGPDKEFENNLEKFKGAGFDRVSKELDDGQESNCTEGMDDYYKHVNLHDENKQFNLEPDEDIAPVINNLIETCKSFKDVSENQGNAEIVDEEFINYTKTVDYELQTNPFPRFERNVENDHALQPTDDKSDAVKETEDNTANSNYPDEISTYHPEESFVGENTNAVEDNHHEDVVQEPDLYQEHFHTNLDVNEDVSEQNQVSDFNYYAQEMQTHSVDDTQESNPLGMIQDGQMSGSGDTDRFAPNIEADEEEEVQCYDGYPT